MAESHCVLGKGFEGIRGSERNCAFGLQRIHAVQELEVLTHITLHYLGFRLKEKGYEEKPNLTGAPEEGIQRRTFLNMSLVVC